MEHYLKLFRVKHYIKNILVFIPLFFGGKILSPNVIMTAFLGFCVFSMLSSIIYILNDLRDLEHDKKHPVKKNRPIASGKISKRKAIVCAVILGVMVIVGNIKLENKLALLMCGIYFALNLFYSFGLKNVPIVDILILASGFLIRIFYGGIITNISISNWLYFVVLTGSLYMGLGKRRNELKNSTKEVTREVLKYYNDSFLDKNMYVCLTLAIVFYSLWTMEMNDNKMIWTVPLLMTILMRYSLDIEGESDGDPVEVMTKDPFLISIILVYIIIVFCFIYLV